MSGLFDTVADQMVAAGQGEALRRWKEHPMDGLVAPRRLLMLFCGFAVMPQAYVTGQSISVDGGFIMR